MNEFKQRFEAYGADYEQTMSRFLDDEEMYVSFLAMFFDDDNLEKLKQALKANDLDAAFDAAHTLKGVSGNLGLAPFYSALCQIVEPLRMREAHAAYPQMIEQIDREYQRVRELYSQLA